MRKVALVLTLVLAGSLAGYIVLARNGGFQLTRQELIEKYTDEHSKFVDVKGMEVHYKDQGSGPPVLLLHGSFGSVHTWDGVVDDLKDDLRLIRFDQPQAALSSDAPPENEGLSLEDFVAAFLDEIGVDRVHLAGTSSGGIIAYRFASKYPERAGKLVIANSPSAVVNNAAVDSPVFLDSLIYVSQNILKHQPRLYWRTFLESLYADPSRVKDTIVDQYFDYGRRTRTAPYVRSLFARVNDTAEIDQVLAQVKAPTLLLWGVPDRVLPEEMGYQLQRKLTAANPELIFLNGTGHYPPVESPDIVAGHIRRFISDNADSTF